MLYLFIAIIYYVLLKFQPLCTCVFIMELFRGTVSSCPCWSIRGAPAPGLPHTLSKVAMCCR